MKRLSTLALVLLVCACDPDPKVPAGSPLDQARALITNNKDIKGAIALLEDARAKQGEDPAIVKGLVELYLAQGDDARAITRARAGLEAHPDANDLYLPLANLYVRLRQIDLALPLLMEARRRGIDDAQVSMSLGTCLATKGDSAGARTEYERARAGGADDLTASMNLALLDVQDNKIDEALPAFEAISAKYPKNAGAKRELARVLLARVVKHGQAGQPLDRAAVDRAMNLLVDVSDVLKSDWRMHEAMGDGWLLLGDVDASVASYYESLRNGGQDQPSVAAGYRAAKKLQNERQQAASANETQPKK